MARESLCALLARENYQVWETGQGDKVESMVREQHPDVVLLDLRLPGKDGLSILKSLHQIPIPPSVIVMTAYGTSDAANPGNQVRRIRLCYQASELRRAAHGHWAGSGRSPTEPAGTSLLGDYPEAVGLRNMVAEQPGHAGYL